MGLDPKTDLIFTRTIAAPRSVVWECWTTPEHIKHFFVPKPHSVESCEIDLRVGGRFDTTFVVDGNEIKNDGFYLEIEDGKRLVFTDGYTKGWKPAADPFMTAIIEFEDDADGGTKHPATARHRSSEARKNHEEMGVFEGWGIVATQPEDYARSL